MVGFHYLFDSFSKIVSISRFSTLNICSKRSQTLFLIWPSDGFNIVATSDSIQQALLKTTDVDTFTLDFKDDFELENEQIIGALIYSIH